MKQLILLIIMLTSSLVSAKCPIESESELSKEQLQVKALLSSAYKLKTQGIINRNLSDFTISMREKFSAVSESLTQEEIASLIVEQDLNDKVCSNSTYPGTEAFTSIVSEIIIETYYGCGCEH